MVRQDFTEEVRPKARPRRMGTTGGQVGQREEEHGHAEGDLPFSGG